MKKSTRRTCRFLFRVVTFFLCLAVLVSLLQTPSRALQKEDVLETYIDRTFSEILGRTAGIEDIRLWYPNLKKGNSSAVSMIDTLTEGAEFQAKGLSTEEKLNVVYRAMLGHDVDQEGKAYWLRLLQGGVSKAVLVHAIAGTGEFKNFCAGYSVKPGDVSITEERDLDPEMTVAISGMCRSLTGRQPEAAELNTWTSALVNNQAGLSNFLLNFMKTDEFKNLGYTREMTVQVLFESMLGRLPDENEKNEYIDVLSHGVSMDFVVDRIAKTEEFANVCAGKGILPGNIELTEPRDMHYELTGFIARFYEKLAGRVASPEELNEGIGQLLSGDRKVTEMLSSVLESSESQDALASNDEFLSAVYEVLYGEQPEADKIEAYKIGLDHGITRSHILKEITKAPAFAEKMAELGIEGAEEKKVPEKVLALTFDDGPYTPVTTRILDALKPYDAHATFFVVGNRVNPYSESVIRAVNQDCEIANHTWNHTTLTRISAAAVEQQMNDCDNAVYNLAGVHTRVMRPVGGSYSGTVAANVGRPMIIWSVDTNDWKYRNAQHVIDEILNNARDGDIVLMHDLYETTAEAVEYVVPKLIEKGFTLVTISELAEYKGIDLQAGEAYFSLRG
ncbi:MAG: DUF4214 domain-containing protein [Clostridiales bacterium]|nr:DUF4214 domain-containing protein [Clostridiales bacterium]